MSKNEANLSKGSTPGTPFTTTRRGNVTVRRAATSSRLAREARQQRLAYVALFGVIALVIITLIVGAVWEYVIAPAQPVATVNGVTIRTDTFNRYQKLQSYLLQNQTVGLQNQIAQLQADTKNKAANTATIQQLNQQMQLVQSNASNIPAYTLQSMESTLEQTQAAAKINAAPTPAQLDAEMANIQKQAGGPAGYGQLLKSTGVQPSDLRTYLAAATVVQNNVTKHFEGTVSPNQPQAKARHILVAKKALADQLAQQIRKGANFAALAKKYSMDNGIQPGTVLTGTAKLQAEQTSSAWNGGWLRDPSQAFVANQPTWITPETQYVAPVLNAVLAMKPGEVRVVQSQYGYHVIQVTQHTTRHLTKTEVQQLEQQHGQTGFQTWQQTATDPSKNKVNPPNPYSQFPSTTGQ